MVRSRLQTTIGNVQRFPSFIIPNLGEPEEATNRDLRFEIYNLEFKKSVTL
ncbi:MAG: hypothetical protein L3J17_08330 [Candidatus Jettenia sp.]|nr:MAG: hypothetical protein L3J17_08330 [Candidatus Jettenia sp.]